MMYIRELLDSLLHKDPRSRLGYKGAYQIKSHSFFDGYDWNALLKKQIDAPFVPTLKHEADVSNFDQV